MMGNMERIFNTMYLIFQSLMLSGQMLFDWLVTPFEDELIVSVFGVTSPIELMFGVSLMLVMTMWLSKWIL